VNDGKIRVAVVFGGRGPEHAISCASGGTVLATLDRDRYEVIPVGILPDGRWVLTSDDPQRLAITGGRLPSVESVAEPGRQILPWAAAPGTAEVDPAEVNPAPADPAVASPVPVDPALARPVPVDPAAVSTTAASDVPRVLGAVDVVLPVLHGPYGEDGTLQGLLEMAGIRYVGAGVLASAVSMDKEYMKLIFAARGLPVGPFVVVRDQDWQPSAAATAALPASAERKRVLDAIGELGWPVFVKPARGGSSIGTSRADDLAGLHEAIETARRYDRKVLVEQAITGREIECAVLEGLDGAPPDTSMPGQLMVDGGEEFFDFEAKYLDDANGMLIPAPIPAEHLDEVRRLAAAAFEAVSCAGLARVDFFYTPDGRILLNEINTMPGMTAASYFPKMWAASGLPLSDLLDRLIAGALRKQPGLR
jgi:D-alanine-D-alanine ligase